MHETKVSAEPTDTEMADKNKHHRVTSSTSTIALQDNSVLVNAELVKHGINPLQES